MYVILALLIIYALIITFYLAKKMEKRVITREANRVLVDTSVLIDGRIEEIAKTGFISGTLVVPKFVIDELQQVADSTDPIKRNKGRRGFKIMKALQKNPNFEVEISVDPYPDVSEVDDKLVHMAKDQEINILTVDYNLNRVADIQGVFTENINELSNAIKPAVLPGEHISVKVVQRGKERNQGVGYLDDGTMVVVEEGEKFMGRIAEGTVSRIFQTDAGRMIFVKLHGSERIETRRKRSFPWRSLNPLRRRNPRNGGNAKNNRY